jgi:hypothetical protein
MAILATERIYRQYDNQRPDNHDEVAIGQVRACAPVRLDRNENPTPAHRLSNLEVCIVTVSSTCVADARGGMRLAHRAVIDRPFARLTRLLPGVRVRRLRWGHKT